MTDPAADRPDPREPAAMLGAGPALRVYALILRYWYLLRGSWPRLLELAYWPTIQMIVWGLVSAYFLNNGNLALDLAGVLITAVLLWNVLFRSQLGVSVSALEEFWSRNLGHLFVSPLTPTEWVLGLFAMSFVRTIIGVVPAALLAILLYGYNVFALGLPLLVFFTMLMVAGWWLSLLVLALLMRFGLGAESAAWLAVFILAPVSAIYYPIDVLPGAVVWIAWALPMAPVFEGMRAVIGEGLVRYDLLALAAGLNVAYMALAGWVYARAFAHARNAGTLLQQGE